MVLYFILYTFTLPFGVSSETFANVENSNSEVYETVCGYMPQGTFGEPVEHTLVGDDYFPSCPQTISRQSSSTTVVAIPNPQAPGGVTYVQHHNSSTTSWNLAYQLQGGY